MFLSAFVKHFLPQSLKRVYVLLRSLSLHRSTLYMNSSLLLQLVSTVLSSQSRQWRRSRERETSGGFEKGWRERGSPYCVGVPPLKCDLPLCRPPAAADTSVFHTGREHV